MSISCSMFHQRLNSGPWSGKPVLFAAEPPAYHGHGRQYESDDFHP